MPITLGNDGSEKAALKEKNHGGFFSVKDGAKKFVPLVYFNESDLPEEIVEMQKEDPTKYLEEAMKRVIFSTANATMFLDKDAVKEYNDKLPEDAEKIRLAYKFETAYKNAKQAKNFVDSDPIAWLLQNHDVYESSPFYNEGNVWNGKFIKNVLKPQEKSYIIGYVPEFDCEMIFELSESNKEFLSQTLKSAECADKFYRNIYNVSKITVGANGASQYMFTRIGEVSEDDNVPLVTSLDLNEIGLFGIEYSDQEKRKAVLELIGLKDKFPTGVSWNK